MSKFLKFIVGLILTVFILGGVALIVPSFIGIDTIVVQENMKGNQAVGTTVYSKEANISEMQQGDKVLELQSNSLNILTVSSYDTETAIATYTNGDQAAFDANGSFEKVIFSVPYLGYLSIATQSFEGLLILLLVIVVVIILFIISEVLRKRNEDDEDEDDYYADLVEKKVASDQAREERRNKKKKHRGRNDDDDDYFRPIEGISNVSPAPAPVEAEERSVAVEDDFEEPVQERGYLPEGTEKSFGASDALPNVQAALEAALENQQMNRAEAGVTGIIPDIQEEELNQAQMPDEIELAMPALSADELLSKAYSAGLDPTITEDDTTGVTLVDYSDCI